MCIFLCFGNSQLCLAALGHILAIGHCKLLRGICNLNIGHGSVILSHADKCYGEEALLSVKAAEIGVNKCSCYLTGTVGTEVEEYNAVAFLYCTVLINNGREHELIGNAVCIGILYSFYRVRLYNTLAHDHSVISLYNSVPCIVSVHCIVSA